MKKVKNGPLHPGTPRDRHLTDNLSTGSLIRPWISIQHVIMCHTMCANFVWLSIYVVLSDGDEYSTRTGRTDDGSDESIISPRSAGKAVLKGIGRFNTIDTLSVQVALKSDSDVQSFKFSKSWAPPRTVLQLSAGSLALFNDTYLVADNYLAEEDLLIELLVLRHLGVDTRTFLENKQSTLDGSACSNVQYTTLSTSGTRVSRILIARLKEVQTSGMSLHKSQIPATVN